MGLARVEDGRSWKWLIITIITVQWRQRGRVVRAPDLKSGDPEFKSRFVRGSPLFIFSAALVHSQLVWLLPVGILNLLSSFQLLVSLALKSPSWSGQLRMYVTGFDAYQQILSCWEFGKILNLCHLTMALSRTFVLNKHRKQKSGYRCPLTLNFITWGLFILE